MMKLFARVFLAMASLSLIATFFLPLWKISLEAPQYPEGLGLYIWTHNITGEKPHDLRNINGLNHYIGMQEIVPNSIPELKIMPFLLGFFVFLGLLAVVIKKKALLYTWVVLLVLTSLVGLGDFYKWGYDYGHNLDEHAAIKVPGMAYQPPVLGSKKLLNFTAHSYPATGGWIIIGALVLAFSASIYTFYGQPKVATGRR